jgi:two-component system OmpR family response regulator
LEGRRILVVDDERSITDLVSMALGLEGATVEVAHTGTDALRALAADPPDLVVLDVMLPDLDGFGVLGAMAPADGAGGSRVPVVFLTARGSLDDRLRGLTGGADDYVTKPFSVEELLLRVDAVLRRSPHREVGARLRVGDLVLDEDGHEVRRDGRQVPLTPTEFRLLHYLMVNAGRVVSKAQIRDRVWAEAPGASLNMVEVYVSYLRRKLDEVGPPVIRTVRGLGYCLRVPSGERTGPSAPDGGADR